MNNVIKAGAHVAPAFCQRGKETSDREAGISFQPYTNGNLNLNVYINYYIIKYINLNILLEEERYDQNSWTHESIHSYFTF